MAATTKTAAPPQAQPPSRAVERRAERPAATQAPADLQRAVGNQALGRLLTAGSGADRRPQPGPATLAALRNRAGGRPLPRATQSSMGGALGADLSGVRVHTGEQAATAAR